MSKSYGAQFLKFSMIFVAPLALLMLVSATTNAGDKNKPPKKGGEKPPEPAPPAKVPQQLSDWFATPISSGGGKEPEDTTVFGGWYTYKGRWIRVDEFPGVYTVEVADIPPWYPGYYGDGKVSDSVTYRGRFRWTVMHDGSVGSPPLGRGESSETGTATRALSFAAVSELTDEARAIAMGEAAAEAAQWIDLYEGGKVQ